LVAGRDLENEKRFDAFLLQVHTGAQIALPRNLRKLASVTPKAVVFDAYGALYDVQSVSTVTDEAFPGYGELITQIWRN
jgi:hypothetical protein